MKETPLGSVIQGSLTKGLEIRLLPDVSVEEMRVGKFLVIQGTRSRFFCLLTDVALGTSNPRILANPPSIEDSLMREVLAGSGTYGTIELAPMLMFTPIEEGKKGRSAKLNQNGNGLGSMEVQSS